MRVRGTLACLPPRPYTLWHRDARWTFPSQGAALELGAATAGAESRWRAVARVLRSPVDAVGSAIFPAECRVCNTPLARLSRAPVCDGCLAGLPPQRGTLCLRCGEALGAFLFATEDRAPGDWLCRPCRMVPPAFDRAVAHGLYRGTLRALLHLLKYDRIEPVARPLGALMAAQYAALPGAPRTVTVVPVPLHEAKRRQRGFNQAELLARALVREGKRRGFALQLETGSLERRRSTESQAGLSPAGRRRNLQAAFAVPARAGLAGCDVLLVDDIFTTGATARAASSALKRAGAREVWVATAARAQKQEFVETEPVHAMETPMEEDVALWG